MCTPGTNICHQPGDSKVPAGKGCVRSQEGQGIYLIYPPNSDSHHQAYCFVRNPCRTWFATVLESLPQGSVSRRVSRGSVPPKSNFPVLEVGHPKKNTNPYWLVVEPPTPRKNISQVKIGVHFPKFRDENSQQIIWETPPPSHIVNITSKQLQELWLWHVPHVQTQASPNEFHKFVPPSTHPQESAFIMWKFSPSLFCKVNVQDKLWGWMMRICMRIWLVKICHLFHLAFDKALFETTMHLSLDKYPTTHPIYPRRLNRGKSRKHGVTWTNDHYLRDPTYSQQMFQVLVWGSR